MSTGSTVPGPATRMRNTCPLPGFFTRITAPSAPASIASPAVVTSMPSRRATIMTVSPRLTRTGLVSCPLRRMSPGRNIRREICPTMSCGLLTGSAMPEISRRSIVTLELFNASFGATAVATTATMAVTRARTTYSNRHPGVSGHRARKRIRREERVSRGSTATGCEHAGAARGVTKLISNCGSVSPAAAICLSSSARAACSICTASGAVAACARALISNNEVATRVALQKAIIRE
jgi:hypothetical protein